MTRQLIILALIGLSYFSLAAQKPTIEITKRLKAIKAVPLWYTASWFDDETLRKSVMKNKKVYLKKTDTIYSNVVSRGTKMIPQLIGYLHDTTSTNIPNSCESGYFTMGELSFFLINDIELVPVPTITKVQWDMMSHCGEYLREGFLSYLKAEGDKFESLYRKYFYSGLRQKMLKGKLN